MQVVAKATIQHRLGSVNSTAGSLLFPFAAWIAPGPQQVGLSVIPALTHVIPALAPAIPALTHVIPTLAPAIPALTHVIPAKAGI